MPVKINCYLEWTRYFSMKETVMGCNTTIVILFFPTPRQICVCKNKLCVRTYARIKISQQFNLKYVVVSSLLFKKIQK